MPHFSKVFKKANLKCKKPRKPRNLLDVAKMKPEKIPDVSLQDGKYQSPQSFLESLEGRELFSAPQGLQNFQLF